MKKLRLVVPSPPGDTAAIPSALGPGALWASVTREYDLSDSGGAAMLEAACRALDRAEACREHIDRDGELVPIGKGGAKEHCLLKAELANRAFSVRCLQKLGLNYEPLRTAPGRPPKSYGE